MFETVSVDLVKGVAVEHLESLVAENREIAELAFRLVPGYNVDLGRRGTILRIFHVSGLSVLFGTIVSYTLDNVVFVVFLFIFCKFVDPIHVLFYRLVT